MHWYCHERGERVWTVLERFLVLELSGMQWSHRWERAVEDGGGMFLS